MPCPCKYLRRILNKCCYCYTLRTGTLLFGCIFLTWFCYLTFGTAFMMECIFPNEYQRNSTPPAALKSTMVFSFFGILSSSMLCTGVHNNNELLFLPFLVFTPIWVFVHILALIIYSFVVVVILLIVITIIVILYSWLVVWSYFVELVYAYDEDLYRPSYM